MIGWGVIALGVAAALFALWRVRTQGRRGILFQAVIGMTLNLLFIGGNVWLGLHPYAPAASRSQQLQGEWRTYSPTGGRYSILMPGAPYEQMDKIDGRLDHYMANLKQPDGTWFGVDYADIPGLDIPANIDDFLEQGIAHFNADATLLERRPFASGSYPGRDTKWRLQSGSLIYRRIFVAHGRMYAVMVGATTGQADARASEIRQFFDSFVILD